MAKGDYYIEGRSLYYDNGNGFLNKGNADGSSNRALRQTGRQVDPKTKQPPSSNASEPTKLNPIKLSPTVNQTSSNSLRYPSEITSSETDYVTFEFFNYNPPFGRGEGQAFGEDFSASTGYDLYNKSGTKDKEKKASDLKSIILYMPEDIQSQYGANWGGADFSTAAVGLSRLTGTELSNPNVAFSAGAGMAKSAIYKTILDGINKFTDSNIGLDQFMGSVSGTILNPNTEMLYQGATLRTFSLSFKMTPRSEKEAVTIKTICNTFKKAMLPGYNGNALLGAIKSTALISVPRLCQVTYMRSGKIHEYLPVYKLCAIAGVDVNYTPDGSYATYKGGSPVSTTLTVSFKETKLLFSDDIDLEGYSY